MNAKLKRNQADQAKQQSMNSNPLARQLSRLAADRWSRQTLRTILRTLWIGLSLCSILLGGSLIWQWNIGYNWILLILMGSLLLGLCLSLRPRMKPHEVARRLDKRFNLQDQLSTALEVLPQRPAPGSVGSYLIDDTRQVMAHVRRFIYTRQRRPWSEIVAVIALLLVLGGLFMLLNPDDGLAQNAPLPLPQLIRDQNEELFPEEEQPPPPGQSQEGGDAAGEGQGAPSDSQSLQAIADALRDQSATRAAADALDQGDTASAARSLRELADQANQLSSDTREEMADSLREAADEVEGRNPDLAEQLRDIADNLEEGGQSAQEAIDDLASAIEQQGQPGQQSAEAQAGEGQGEGEGQGQGEAEGEGQGQAEGEGEGQTEGQGQGQGDGAGNSSTPGEQREQRSDRLNVPGVPMDLESEGDGDSRADGDVDPQVAPAGSGSGSTRDAGAGDAGLVEADDDPLRIPIEDRDVVQDYFSPTD